MAPRVGPAALRVESSTVESAGLGLFAAEELPEYVVIGEYSGEVKDYARFGEKVARLGHNELHPFYLKPGLLAPPRIQTNFRGRIAHGIMEPKRRRLEPDKASWLSLLKVRLPHRDLVLATDCGGGVGPASALRDLGVPIRHIFACESEESSQQLLAAQQSRPERLFGSMIGRDRGCFCLVSGRWMPMPTTQPDIYISNAGTHGPNPDRFFAAVKYIMEFRPRLVILEDLVAACREDPQGNLPADAVLALLEQVGGYEVDLFHVFASHFGLPQRRQRLYYVMVSREHLKSEKVPDQIRQALERLKLHAFSTTDAEELLEAALDPGDVRTERGVDSLLSMSSDASYLHRRLRHELHLGEDAAYFALAGNHLARWLRSYREADLCQIHWLWAQRQNREIRFVSISQDVHRASLSFTGEVPTLAANTRLWSYRLQRVLSSREMLTLQGFKPAQWNLESLSEASLSRVAGSAMTVHMIAALLAAALSAVRLEEPSCSQRRRSVSLAELRSRYSAICQRLHGVRRHAKLGA
ncbi:unnamed protein product [Effrenium voratum]|uniref:Uncharacterized protein n=1 Tax=Effrenium voratum TaxID=2562239 RepID=A0AA36JPX2_9DINO|nr:unnamed protein product [Effrenium voratum]